MKKEYLNEEWKDIKGYEGLYQVSNYGRIKSLDRIDAKGNRRKSALRIQGITKCGYYTVRLCKNGKLKNYLVHRLVAEAFIPNPYNLPCVNHKDENKQNNNVDNLEWCTKEYNNNYGTKIERQIEKSSKTVFQYSLNGELINEFTSTQDVERKLGYCQPGISRCCNGKYKTAYGYKWSYNKIDKY